MIVIYPQIHASAAVDVGLVWALPRRRGGKLRSPLHAQCPPSVTFLVNLSSVGNDLVHLYCWIWRISCWFHRPCSKSKLVEKSKVQFKSTKGQRQAWEETTYIGKIRLQSSFGRLQPFFTFPAPPEIHRSRLHRNVVTVLQPLLWCGSAEKVWDHQVYKTPVPNLRSLKSWKPGFPAWRKC